jgi:ribosomal protein S18 acetylase RimI-like enzyme
MYDTFYRIHILVIICQGLLVLKKEIVYIKIKGGGSMKISLSNSIENVEWSRMKEIYHSVGWTNHNEEKIKKVFQSSNVVAIAYDEDNIAGFGRALSDGVFNAAIYDVVVDEQYQNKGIGQKVIKNLLAQLDDISCVHLVSTAGNEEFYRKAGFRKMKTGMARYLNRTLAEEYLE